MSARPVESSAADVAVRLDLATTNGEPISNSIQNDVKQDDNNLKTRDDDKSKDLGLIFANFSDELSIIAQPISADNERRRRHQNDQMISMEEEDRSYEAAAMGAVMEQAASGAANTQTSPNQPPDIGGAGSGGGGGGGGQWMMNMAAHTTQEMRQRVSLASDQLGLSLRHLYASAATMATVDVPPSYHNIPGIVPYYRGHSSGPPPSYDDVINPYAPPPTYQSLFGQMREASKNSRGFIDLLKRLVILSTIGCSLLLVFVVLVPFSMILVGAIYINDCRIEHIPGFLLIGGLVWASKNLIHCGIQCQEEDSADYGYYEEQQSQRQVDQAGIDSTNITLQQEPVSQEQTPQTIRRSNQRTLKSSVCESLLNCVLFGWFIAGCVIVFRNHDPEFDDSTSPRYCNRTVYMYTFWLITSGLVTFSFFVSCICCLMISSAIATRQDDDLG